MTTHKAGIVVEHPAVAERAAGGRATRKEASRSVHAGWNPAPDRADPVELLEQQAKTRMPELVPNRYGRTLASAFTFFRGVPR